MRHVVDAIAAQGRNGDDELLHISKRELRDLKTIGDAIGIKTTVNPKTGIHEAFNWGKMLATGAGGTLGFVASGFNPMGAAAGAALASGAYTAAEGGNTQQILMNSAISGATAYAGAGIAQGLGEAGQAAAGSATQGVTQTGTQTLAGTGGATIPGVGTAASAPIAGTTTASIPGTTLGGAGSAGGSSGSMLSGAGVSGLGGSTAPIAGTSTSAIPGTTLSTTPTTPITGSDILKGFQNTSGKDLISQYGGSAMKTGVGLATLGALPSNYNTTTSTSSTGSSPKAETYVTPDGQRRTRIVGMAMGGLASMSRGRYLQGPGDGMSDSIPAEIDGKQQARLATGEFVVPADVVSGLGNGDSNSGAKQLHSMMDRVRMDRTGTKKQGKQINPQKLMPA